MTRPQAPPDRCNAVLVIFFLLGLCTLLPWNFFITATGYFKSRLAESHEANETGEPREPGLLGNASGVRRPPPSSLERSFNSWLTLSAMLPLLVFTCVNTMLHHRVPVRVRMLGSLLVILLFFVFTAALVRVPALGHHPAAFFGLTMATAVIINTFGALLQGTTFGLVGLLPQRYTTSMMSGQGMAGTFAALAMIFSLLEENDPKDSAFSYFMTACAIILITIVVCAVMPRLEFARFHFSKKGRRHEVEESELQDIILPDSNKPGEGEGAGLVPEENLENLEITILERDSVLNILKQIWVLALSVCVTFTITLGVFPAITADVVSTSAVPGSRWESLFIPISCFLLFNLLDWIGRSCTAFVTFPKRQGLLLLFVCVRAAFVPLFMLCNVRPRGATLPVLFPHDAVFIVLMLLFALSNGYFATLAMSNGPKRVAAHNAETAGTIMAFFLSLGLSLGAAISFLFRSLV